MGLFFCRVTMDANAKFQRKIVEWREHPAQMVRELFEVNPDPWQEEALETYGKVPRLAMVANKGPGKTATLAWIAWNFLLTRPFPKMAATSISGDNLNDGFWSELAKWQSKAPILDAMFEWTKTRVFNKQNPNNWWMSARTWPKSGSAEDQANTLAGLHDDYIMFILDESGSIPDAVMVAAEAALTGGPKEAHVIQAGNPTQLSGPLYRAAHSARDLWYVINITGDPDNPKRSSRMTVEYAREQIKQYGRYHPYVLVNIFGEFPPASLNALIGPDEVRAAMNRYYRDYELRGEPKIIGVDISRYGDDASVLAFRHGRQMFNFEAHRNIDGNQGASIVNRRWAEFEADAVFLDGTGGFGTSWEDNLKRLGRQPFSVHFNSAPHEKLRFDNRRAEMYWNLCMWIRAGGAVPPDEEFLRELTETTYSIPKDVVILEPKLAIKARIGRSPDKADAAALTFAEPITPVHAAPRIIRRNVADYDPYGEPVDRSRSRAYHDASNYNPYG